MKEVTVIGLLLIVVICVFTLTGCKKNQADGSLCWKAFENSDKKSEDVAISVDIREIADGKDDVTIVLKNGSDYELSYFDEDIYLQKKIGSEWNTWKKGDTSNQPSAEIEQMCLAHDENSLLISSNQLLPSKLRESGEYRVYLSFSYIKGSNEWERAYTCFEFTIE